MSEALPDVNLAHKAEVERKLNIGKEKKAAADECFKAGDIKGACHIKNGNWKRAEEAANQVLKKNPDNQKAKLRKAKALAGLGFAEKAVVILEELHTADPNDTEITRELAKAKEADKAATARGFKKFKGFLSKSSGAEAVAMDESSDTDDVEEVTTKLEESRIEERGMELLKLDRPYTTAEGSAAFSGLSTQSKPVAPATRPTAARKGKIRPPRRAPESESSEQWKILQHSIREIFNHNARSLSFEENYRHAYNMCLQKQGSQLYEGVSGLIVENLDKLAKEQIVPAFPTSISVRGIDHVQQAQEGERLLKAVREVWDDHISRLFPGGLHKQDRTHVPPARVLPIFEQGQQLFLERVIRSQDYSIRTHLITTLLTQIQIERDGYTVNRSAVKGCVEVLLELRDRRDSWDSAASVYEKDFEPTFLKESEAFYKAEATRLLDSCNAMQYLKKVEERFMSESSRTQYYLSSKSEAPLIAILESHLLIPHLQTVIYMQSSGLDFMIDGDRIDDLARMYRLFIRVPEGPPTLQKALKESVIRRGKEVNALATTGPSNDADAEGDGEGEDAAEDTKAKAKKKAPAQKGAASRAAEAALQWMQSVLELKDKMDKLLKRCFADDLAIQTSLSDAFETFINDNPKSPEYISLFIDENLRKGLKGKSDQDVDAVLEKTITVFRYISERDVFERYYKGHLAKRLLQNRSVSDDAERGMLAKLKVECGVQFTQKLEGMFNDLKVSSDHMSGFRDHLAKSQVLPPIDISVNVLTSTFWPMALKPAPCNFPPSMVDSCKVYDRFYQSRHTGRKLSWQPSMGSADVRATFKTRTHDLNVSTFALVILLLFENLGEGEFLTYEELKDATGIEETELKRQLQSLACAKFRVLKKHPPGRDVANDDSFSFNYEFTCPMQKIKISTISSKVENPEQRRETMERVDEERKHQTDACIVRIMKDRKVLSHTELIMEVTRQLATRFQPAPPQIKKRIEALIEREYLDRGDDKNSYRYLA
ncbi:Cullin-3 [Tulasnella sp. UAMH 9824]|nr:Cullin-3 [Tulasnella sp. UAMH 9824]